VNKDTIIVGFGVKIDNGARDIATKIESTMQYPGTIKVNVIRETRAIEFAK
jgi:HD superfamily phosphodiesterase